LSFNLGLLKEHPYITGSVVVVGGIVVFYLLSSSGSSSASSGNSDYASALAADSANQQAQAAAAIQTNAQNAQLQATQIAASVQNNQTAASVTENDTNTLAALAATLQGNNDSVDVNQTNADAATLQQANQLTSEQNIYSIQEGGLEDQINQAAEENANNNATSLSGLVDQLNAQGQIASQTIGAATTLAMQQQTYQEQNVQSILPNVGKQYNSALDANNANAEYETILSGGSPTVATAGVNSSASTANSANAATASILSSISKLGSSISTGLFS
jgi:hypothetical protein